jgi:hypothetical protein
MKLRIGCAIVGFLLLALSLVAQTASGGSASSQVPPLIQFSNVASDEGGSSMSGVVNLTFSLYAAQQGGEPLWTETQNNVQLDATGHYSVQLGITKPNGVPTTLFTSGEARWLGVRIAEQAEQPRVLLLSVPYALKAGDAATIGGLPPSAFVLAAPGTGSASTTFVAFALSSETQAGLPTGTDVTGLGTVNFIPLWTSTSNIANSVLFQSAASPFRIGINTITPATTLDVKGAGTIRGVLALPPTAAATAAKGADSQPLNLVASAFNTTAAVNQTFQWEAEPAGNDTAKPSATLNLLFGAGTTKPAETGLHIASNGLITFATGQTFPGGGGSGTVTSVATGLGLKGGPITTSGTLTIDTTVVPQLGATNTFAGNQTVNGTLFAAASSLGVQATTTSANGVGINALSSAATGTGVGVVGASNSPTGFGLEGINNAITGTAVGVFGATQSTSGYGIEGSSPAIGVIGLSLTGSGGGTGVAGESNGSLGAGVSGLNTATTGTAAGVYGTSSSTTGYAVVGLQGGAGVTPGVPAGVYGATASSAGYGVEGTSAGTGVFGTGLVGVDGLSSSTGGAGVNGIASATTGITYGVHGLSQSPTGYGVGGDNVATTGNSPGVFGTSASTSGFGVYGYETATGPTIGVLGQVSSAGGIGTEGSSPFAGVLGSPGTWAISGTGAPYGVVGASNTVGVYGASSGPSLRSLEQSFPSGAWGDYGGTSGTGFGVLGTADDNWAGAFYNTSSSDSTILAINSTTTAGGDVFLGQLQASGASAIIGDPGCGSGFIALQLSLNGMSDCDNYTLTGGSNGETYLNAVAGKTVHLRVNNSDALVASSSGVSINGTLSKGGGSFKIDHPLDPANKYLYHSFVESPDMKNIYDGTTTTDGSGLATVTLPDWFESLNRDFRYQLTVIGQFAQAIVASKVANNQFRIQTDKPNVEVSWQVTGIRQDAFANANRIPVEVEKAPADRGRYLYPEVIGQPAAARIGYEAPPPGSEHIVHQRPSLARRSDASPMVGGVPLGPAVRPMPNLQKPSLPPSVKPAPGVAPPAHPPAQANPKASTPPAQSVMQPVAAQPR